ncbi:MAG TPA: phage tail protein [Pyrinomonadaceae bacterium]|jgi:phage tail-like protein
MAIQTANPLLNHNFVISLIDSSSVLGASRSLSQSAIFDVAVGGFSECTGLEMSMQPDEFKEGGNNGFVHKFPTRVTWSNIVLKKGIGSGTVLWDWQYGFAVGKGKRRDGVIILLSDSQVPNNVWHFRRGLPVKYSGPALNATQSAVAVESIEIAHEGIYQVPLATS